MSHGCQLKFLKRLFGQVEVLHLKRLWTPWRIAVRDRTERLIAELQRVPEALQEKVDYKIADECMKEAQRVAGIAASNTSSDVTGPFAWISGAAVEQTWSALHRAEEALLMVMTDIAARLQAVGIRAAMAHWPSADTRTALYQQMLDAIIAGTGALTVEQRETLRGIREAINTRSDTAHARERALRNILYGLSAVLLIVLLVFCVGQLGTSSVFSTCAVSGTTSPSCRSVSEIALASGFGGLISVIAFIGSLQSSSGPYNLGVAQAVLKVISGAAIGLFRVLLVQHGVLDILAPQNNNRILAYAVLFGFAQQLVTQAADKRAADIVGSTPSARTGPAVPAVGAG